MDHSSVIYLMAPDGSYLTHFTHASTAENIAKALAERVDPAQAAGAGSSRRPRSPIGDTPAAFRVEEVQQIGRPHFCTPVTNAHLLCRLLLSSHTFLSSHFFSFFFLFSFFFFLF